MDIGSGVIRRELHLLYMADRRHSRGPLGYHRLLLSPCSLFSVFCGYVASRSRAHRFVLLLPPVSQHRLTVSLSWLSDWLSDLRCGPTGAPPRHHPSSLTYVVASIASLPISHLVLFCSSSSLSPGSVYGDLTPGLGTLAFAMTSSSIRFREPLIGPTMPQGSSEGLARRPRHRARRSFIMKYSQCRGADPTYRNWKILYTLSLAISY